MDHEENIARAEEVIDKFTLPAQQCPSLDHVTIQETMPMAWMLSPLRSLKQSLYDLKDLGVCREEECINPTCITKPQHIGFVKNMQAIITNIEEEVERLRTATVEALVSVHECQCVACVTQRQMANANLN